MNPTVIHIKNMVCPRCIKSVKQTLKAQELATEKVELGRVVLKAGQKPDLPALRKALEKEGFVLLEDTAEELVNDIKSFLIESMRFNPSAGEPFTSLLSARYHRSYSSLSKNFKKIENRSISEFVISLKIEIAKEYLCDGKYSVKEVAARLDYSSLHYFSQQFKKVTGLSPTDFKAHQKRQSLDQV
jgi:AraC-like DNA-binding protein